MSDLPLVGVLHQPYGPVALREIFVAANGLCQPTVLLRQPVAEAYPNLVEIARKLFPVHILSAEGIADAVAGLGLQGVTAFHDAELELAEEVAQALCLPGVSGLAQPWDKLNQRQAFARVGLSTLRAEAVDSVATFLEAVRLVGLPAVLKPRRAAGGRGVTFIRSQDDVSFQQRRRTAWAGLLLETLIPSSAHPSGIPWLADYVSVETVNAANMRSHVAIFDKTPINVTPRAGTDGSDIVAETGDVTPSRLPPDMRDLALERTSAALDALDVRWRVTHTELRITQTEVEVIEVNGRVGGYLARLLRPLGGPDLVRAALTVALGRVPNCEGPVGDHRGYMFGLYMPFPRREGVVASRVTRADLRALPGVVGVDEMASPGEPRQDSRFLVADVTVRADSDHEIDAIAAAVVRGIAHLYAADGLESDPWLQTFSLP
jgi:biotin carboxylase